MVHVTNLYNISLYINIRKISIFETLAVFRNELSNLKYQTFLILIRGNCSSDTDTRYMLRIVSRYKIQDTFFVS